MFYISIKKIISHMEQFTDEDALLQAKTGQIILLEGKMKDWTLTKSISVKTVTDENCKALIISSSLSFKDLLSYYRGTGVNLDMVQIIDVISKKDADKMVKLDNVTYMDTSTSLKELFEDIESRLKNMLGEKILFIDSIESLIKRYSLTQVENFVSDLYHLLHELETGAIIFVEEAVLRDDIMSSVTKFCDRIIHC